MSRRALMNSCGLSQTPSSSLAHQRPLWLTSGAGKRALSQTAAFARRGLFIFFLPSLAFVFLVSCRMVSTRHCCKFVCFSTPGSGTTSGPYASRRLIPASWWLYEGRVCSILQSVARLHVRVRTSTCSRFLMLVWTFGDRN